MVYLPLQRQSLPSLSILLNVTHNALQLPPAPLTPLLFPVYQAFIAFVTSQLHPEVSLLLFLAPFSFAEDPSHSPRSGPWRHAVRFGTSSTRRARESYA